MTTRWLTAAFAATLIGSGAARAQVADLDDLKKGLEPMPIETIAMDMTDVGRDLARQATDRPVQEKQEQIVAKLDELIKQLDKECQCCKGSRSGRSPKRPAASSQLRSGSGGQDLHATKKGGSKWAEIPPHLRDKILQSQTEGMPPEYQRMLERYRKLLADEQPNDAAAPAKTEAPKADAKAPAPK
ncbi:MAG TPA: hypothetical protein VNC50_00900 [Planctomycetia bacterium]|nr:hypothetical protein [Planctomycetia bacterium]